MDDGLERVPPMIGPTIPPIDQIRGIHAKASAIFVSSVISAMIFFVIPMFPFDIPWMNLLISRSQYDFESPNVIIDVARPTRPINMTGLRPMRSERRPQ